MMPMAIAEVPLPSGPEVDRWEEEKRLYPMVIARLENARGPDRKLDIDIAIVLGKLADLSTRNSPEPLCYDGLPVPRFTDSLQDVEVIVGKDFPGGDWHVQEAPHVEAEILEQYPDGSWQPMGSAWNSPNDGTYMTRPPANTAIALTLAMLRALEEMLG